MDCPDKRNMNTWNSSMTTLNQHLNMANHLIFSLIWKIYWMIYIDLETSTE